MALRIGRRDVDQVTILDLHGKLAGEAGEGLAQRIEDLIAVGRTLVIVNLREVPFIDSAALGGLLSKRAALHDAVYRVPAQAVPLLRDRMGDAIHRKVRDHLQVHGVANQSCPTCGTKLTHITSNGIRTDYCRQCQPGSLLGRR